MTSIGLEEIEGVVQGHRDGHGFVSPDDGSPDIYLPPNEMRAVLHRDHVKVRVVRHDKRGRPEGRVVEIVQRPPHPIIGRLLHEGGIWLVAPEDKRYGQDVLIPKQGIGEAKAGEVVVVELTEPPALYGQPIGRVREVLGDIDDAGMEIEIAVRKYGVPHEFSAPAMAEARALPDTVRPADKAGRVDLTDVPLCTIDGEDARDFDDAVYCEPAVVTGRGKKPNGWRLLVAIADVSHYVKTNSPIDVDAYDRATSVYFPRRVIPMLPEKLSNGLCSLNPDVDRLCMVCDMLVTANGDVHAYQFYPAVMHSHARFTYTEVAAILANTRGPEAAKRKARVKDLENLHDVFRALLKARHARGAVDFDTVETQIIADESGRIERIEPRTRNDAHRLIEECMLAANVSSADYILGSKHAGLFRVHEGPTPEKMELLRAYLKALGLGLSISDEPHPSEFQRIAEATKDRPDAEQIHMMLLRSMSQAIYTPTNSGHFGLGYEAYTHFTSPIRRYPDLLVHRVIKAILQDRKYQLPDLPTPGEAHEKLTRRLKKQSASRRRDEGAPPKRLSEELLGWEAAGLHCSANERRAEEASRDVESWLKCKYMKEHLGEVFNGTVTAVTTFGLFVTLNELHVEGLVHITELGGEYFRFDEVRQELRGERTGIRYIIGSKVRVQVSRVDLDGRKIDFRMVSENDELPARPPRDRAGSAAAEGRAGNTAKPAKSAKSAKAGGRAARPPRADGEGPSRQAMSPIQALKASLKKATGRAKKSSKPRKTRR
ncbi:ribonuclease R [Ottowia oryzae]|uniref:Ribonuclease R n=1 Tax=Ottowia oryzae TaxID=2109914 RepID=A0A2S0MJW6_9BURK|nr:ribonuclease R [Ottowia oryzae]AVO36169.1 ribonuclease R [Ottowia oryzae]